VTLAELDFQLREPTLYHAEPADCEPPFTCDEILERIKDHEEQDKENCHLSTQKLKMMSTYNKIISKNWPMDSLAGHLRNSMTG